MFDVGFTLHFLHLITLRKHYFIRLIPFKYSYILTLESIF